MYKSFIDETNKQYGKLTVIKPVKLKNSRKMLWQCRCECGNEIICSGSDLRAGRRTSCGKHCNSIINEAGKNYGYLTVLYKDQTPAINFPDKSVHWICKCNNCNRILSISGRSLRNGTISCGCIKSKGEKIISSILDNFDIPYQKEFTFPDLISPFSKFKLRFDFAILNKNNIPLFLIEYQGEQHEKEIKYFGDKLNKIQECDKLKRDYCSKHNIPLFIITHIKGKTPSYEALKDLLINLLEDLSNELSTRNDRSIQSGQ